MQEVREKALQLRLRGWSYNEIEKELGVPKSTQSGWFKDVVLSDKARKRLEKRKRAGTKMLIKRNKEQTHKAWARARAIQSKAKKEVGKISKRELFLIGVGLYWAEGYKKLLVRGGKKITSHVISFTNADPLLIRWFILFLKEIMSVAEEDIRLTMRLYKHINEKEAMRHWIEATGLTKKHFAKSTFLVSRASKGKRPYNRLQYGTLQIAVYNTKEFHRIIGWIEGLKEYVK